MKIFSAVLCLALVASMLCGCVGTALDNSDEGRAAQRAKASFDSYDYPGAVKSYAEAAALCETKDPDKARFYKGKLSDAYREWALDLAYGKGDKTVEAYEQAITLCESAKQADPDSRRRCDELIAEFTKRIGVLKYRAEISEVKLIPDGKKLKEKIDIYLRQGKALAAAKRYSDARDKFEEALRLDPYNMEATQELKKLNLKLAQAGRERAAADRAERVAEVEWKYVSPLQRKDSPGGQEPAAGGLTPAEISMRDTVIPSLDFKSAKLPDVFAQLETAGTEGGKGPVKFVFDGVDPASDEWPLIVFKAEKIPLGEAVNSICKALGLLYVPDGPDRIKVFRKP